MADGVDGTIRPHPPRVGHTWLGGDQVGLDQGGEGHCGGEADARPPDAQLAAAVAPESQPPGHQALRRRHTLLGGAGRRFHQHDRDREPTYPDEEPPTSTHGDAPFRFGSSASLSSCGI